MNVVWYAHATSSVWDFFSPSQTSLKEDSLEYETKIWKDCKASSLEEESLNAEVTKARVPKDFKLVER